MQIGPKLQSYIERILPAAALAGLLVAPPAHAEDHNTTVIEVVTRLAIVAQAKPREVSIERIWSEGGKSRLVEMPLGSLTQNLQSEVVERLHTAGYVLKRDIPATETKPRTLEFIKPTRVIAKIQATVKLSAKPLMSRSLDLKLGLIKPKLGELKAKWIIELPDRLRRKKDEIKRNFNRQALVKINRAIDEANRATIPVSEVNKNNVTGMVRKPVDMKAPFALRDKVFNFDIHITSTMINMKLGVN